MAKRAEGWKLRPDRRTGIQFVRFRHAKIRYEISTGERDLGVASGKAAFIYSEVVSGRWERTVTIARPGQPLDEVAALWLADVETECKPKTWKLYKLHIQTHLVPFFASLDRVVPPRVADYRRMRLRKVLRETVIKELTTLRRLCRWAVEQDILREVPKIANPPPGAAGVDDARGVRHKRKPIPISQPEAQAIIAALPERASRARRGHVRHVVRDFFVVLWETGLRPETVSAIEAPGNFRKGALELTITPDVDKVKYARELPLTDAARDALARNVPEVGRIFGTHDFRDPFRKACRAALGDDWRAEQVTPYDFRHGRTTDLLDQPGATLPGVSYLVGHKQITTTNRYVHAPKAAGAAILSGGRAGGTQKGRERV